MCTHVFKSISLCILMGLSCFVFGGTLDGYLYDTRPLLIFSSSSDHPSFEKQVRLFQGFDCEFYVRDIEILTVVGDGKRSRVDGQILEPEEVLFLKQELEVGAYQEMLVLVGKDGKVKLRAHIPIEPRDLFMLIDAMPLRKAERMRRAAAACNSA